MTNPIKFNGVNEVVPFTRRDDLTKLEIRLSRLAGRLARHIYEWNAKIPSSFDGDAESTEIHNVIDVLLRLADAETLDNNSVQLIYDNLQQASSHLWFAENEATVDEYSLALVSAQSKLSRAIFGISLL